MIFIHGFPSLKRIHQEVSLTTHMEYIHLLLLLLQQDQPTPLSSYQNYFLLSKSFQLLATSTHPNQLNYFNTRGIHIHTYFLIYLLYRFEQSCVAHQKQLKVVTQKQNGNRPKFIEWFNSTKFFHHEINQSTIIFFLLKQMQYLLTNFDNFKC